MKEIWNYIHWSWVGFQTWQKMFVFAMLLQITGWIIALTYSDVGLWISHIGLVIVLGYIFKWFIFDNVKDSWNKYKQERNKLLTTIKESDN